MSWKTKIGASREYMNGTISNAAENVVMVKVNYIARNMIPPRRSKAYG